MKQNMKEAIGLSLKRYNDTYMKAANDRIDNIVSQAGTDNTEIVDARIDSAGVTHTTLNNRILAETKMNDQHLVSCSGEHITAENTMGGSITNLEVLGNTIQNEEDLADIKSVGELQEDGTYKMSILSCGKNLFNANDIDIKKQSLLMSDGSFNFSSGIDTTGFIKVKAGQKIVCSGGVNGWYGGLYTENKIWRKAVQSDAFTVDKDGYYRVSFTNNNYSTVQIEEGTVATPYEPYQENKCDILLPCQLEKVGDVADRLYYDDVEKAWCIEKNVGEVVLNGSEVWLINDDTQVNTIHFRTPILDTLTLSKANQGICNRFICQSIYLKDIEGCAIEGSSSHLLRIAIFRNKLSTQDVTGFKTWLSQNPTLVKYQLATPQKIVLPLDVQIALNSFFGTTHVYMESGEVEGTIKCKIPKSLGATVQSLNNKTDILSDRIEAIEGLKDSQNMKYETDKGYLVCKETKNGVIDDLKIEGKTLVNLCNIIGTHTIGPSKVITPSKPINSTFRIEFNIVESTIVSTSLGVYMKISYKDSSIPISYIPFENKGISIGVDGVTVTPKGEISTITIEKHSSVSSGDVKIQDIIIMPCGKDLKSLNVSYFEGLKSVGGDVDEIEVSSVNENLFDGKLSLGYLNGNGIVSPHETWVASDFINIQGVPQLNFESTVFNGIKSIGLYDSDKEFVDYIFNAKTPVKIGKTVKYVRISMCKDPEVAPTQYELDNPCITIYINSKTDKKHQSDKKQILFYNTETQTWEKPILREWDSIEKHSDNKWYYHKRSGKVVLNGSESGWNVNTQTDTTMRFEINMVSKNMAGNRNPIICDKFNLLFNYELNCVEEGVFTSIGGSTLFINIDKSKLSSQDVEGFKKWLQANNVTVVYQLAEEEVYEIAPLHLDSYANETLILCNSGAISPKMEFSITSHINELVKAYGERINLLEEKVYQYMVTQNRMQLASTYSADSVTFKVDYFSLCGDEENYNEDLYNLILNNILVGKDNYDYDKMFTIILDYASWNQISWEQFDILVGLMDMQHNPPVEELPTEDEIEEDIIEEDIIENEETPVE